MAFFFDIEFLFANFEDGFGRGTKPRVELDHKRDQIFKFFGI